MEVIVSEGDHGGEGLDGFSKSHLIAEEDALLVEDVLDAPELVASEGTVQSGQVDRSIGDVFFDLVA